MADKIINVYLVEDHKLLRKGLAELIEDFPGFTVIGEANNGKELTDRIQANFVPDIVLLDINMPEMNGYETALWLKARFPQIRILALSMYDDEKSVIKMIKAGARGYILKDAEPSELLKAFHDVMRKGYYHSDLVSSILINNVQGDLSDDHKQPEFNDREMDFLRLACSELTYKEIADKMCLAPRTIDSYRESLFEKLSVKSRVGLALYAVKNGIVNMDSI